MTIAHPFAKNAKERGTPGPPQETCKLMKSNLLNTFNFSLDEVETRDYSCFEHVQHSARGGELHEYRQQYHRSHIPALSDD
jgi:hypothetical protein